MPFFPSLLSSSRPQSSVWHLLVSSALLVMVVSGLAACKEPTEREKAEKLAKKHNNSKQLISIEAVHNIIDLPPPTDAEKKAIVQKAVNNMVRVEGGEFIMGVERLGGDWEGWKPLDVPRQSANIRDDAFHEHPVRLSTYYVSKYETTYADFDAFIRDTGREFRFGKQKGAYHGLDTAIIDCCRAPNKPAAADWYEAKAYCEWLGEHSGLPFNLLTEAQWEYAARERGKWLMFPTKRGGINRYTNWKDNETVAVDSMEDGLNDLGIYMLAGNLSEWVLDWYDPDYYQKSPVDNPMNDTPVMYKWGSQAAADHKVHRGGHQYNDESFGDHRNVFNRFYDRPSHRSVGTVGIRCGINTEEAL